MTADDSPLPTPPTLPTRRPPGLPDRIRHLIGGQEADSADGRLLADAVVPAGAMEAVVRSAASEVISAGSTSLVANRQALSPRVSGECFERLRLASGQLQLFERIGESARVEI